MFGVHLVATPWNCADIKQVNLNININPVRSSLRADHYRLKGVPEMVVISTAGPFLLCTVLLLCVSTFNAIEHNLIKTITHEFDVQPRTSEYYCFTGSENLLTWQTLFNEVKVDVADTAANDFPWHAVRGSSTDDFHTHVEKVLFKALGTPPGHQSTAVATADGAFAAAAVSAADSFEENSLIWDVLSSCPSPLHAVNLHSCSMRFPTVGKSCISINTDKAQHVSIKAVEQLNPQYVYNLLAGLFLISSASYLARSKLFQYSTGSFIFISGGVVIMVLYVAMKVLSGQRSAVSWMRYSLMGMIFSTGYGAALIWFLRHNLSVMMLEYWEYVASYISVFCVLGLWWVWLVRSNEQSKENVKFVVQWVIRLAGAAAVYNGSASPMGSLFLLGALLIICSVYSSCCCARYEKSADVSSTTNVQKILPTANIEEPLAKC